MEKKEIQTTGKGCPSAETLYSMWKFEETEEDEESLELLMYGKK